LAEPERTQQAVGANQHDEHSPAAHAAGAHAEEHKSSIFDGGIGNSIVTLAIFGIVLYVLGKYAWPPLIKVLNDREYAIRTSLENAAKERKEAEKLLAQYKEQIDKARVEATAIVDEGRRGASRRKPGLRPRKCWPAPSARFSSPRTAP
jgi:hypothetical protein